MKDTSRVSANNAAERGGACNLNEDNSSGPMGLDMVIRENETQQPWLVCLKKVSPTPGGGRECQGVYKYTHVRVRLVYRVCCVQ